MCVILYTYRQQFADADLRIGCLLTLVNTNSLFRLATIIGGGAALFAAVQTESVLLVVGLFLVIVVCFMALVWRQSKLEARKAAWEDFLAVKIGRAHV